MFAWVTPDVWRRMIRQAFEPLLGIDGVHDGIAFWNANFENLTDVHKSIRPFVGEFCAYIEQPELKARLTLQLIAALHTPSATLPIDPFAKPSALPTPAATYAPAPPAYDEAAELNIGFLASDIDRHFGDTTPHFEPQSRPQIGSTFPSNPPRTAPQAPTQETPPAFSPAYWDSPITGPAFASSRPVADASPRPTPTMMTQSGGFTDGLSEPSTLLGAGLLNDNDSTVIAVLRTLHGLLQAYDSTMVEAGRFVLNLGSANSIKAMGLKGEQLNTWAYLVKHEFASMINLNASNRQCTAIINTAYIHLTQAMGPVYADQLLSDAITQVERMPVGRARSPRLFL